MGVAAGLGTIHNTCQSGPTTDPPRPTFYEESEKMYWKVVRGSTSVLSYSTTTGPWAGRAARSHTHWRPGPTRQGAHLDPNFLRIPKKMYWKVVQGSTSVLAYIVLAQACGMVAPHGPFWSHPLATLDRPAKVPSLTKKFSRFRKKVLEGSTR